MPSLRKQIDRLDRQLLRLLNQRAALALRVGRAKREDQLPVFDPVREQRILRLMVRTNRGPLSPGAIRTVFQEILRQSRRLEQGR